jgi:cytochrome c
MDSMDVNKAVAAVLVAGIAFFITGMIGDNLVFTTPPAKPPFSMAGMQTAATGAAKPAGPEPIAPLLASADVAKGKQFVNQVCAACHSFNKGGKPIVGPNLWNIVDAPHDHEAGFAYSDALEKFKGKPWTYEALNAWLYKPASYAPGTHMTFAGLPDTKLRADVVAYLRTLSDNPQPLPKVTAAAAPAKAAPGGAPAGAPSGLDARLAKADIAKGKQFANQVCAACHSLNEGGKPIVGPNLWGVVGGPHDHEAGFAYSPAMEKYKGKPWTFAALDDWLTDPAKYAPGTHMTFSGIPQPQLRADVIAYLDSLSKKPVPLPKAAPAPAAAAPAAAPAPAPAAPAAHAGLDERLAKADVAKGKQFAGQVCAMCHTLDKGGKSGIGPNLWGVVGGPHDHEAGFAYSPALEKYKGKPWTFAALDDWLTDPAHYAPGTHMTFAGIPQPQQRADVIAYLDTLADHPVPLPKAGGAK